MFLLSDIRTDHYIAVPDLVPSHVSFETLGADGEWSACTRNEETSEASSTLEHHVTSPILPQSPLKGTHVVPKQHAETPVFEPTDQILDDFAIGLPPKKNFRDVKISDIGFMYDDRLDFQLSFAPEVDPQTTSTMWTPGSFDCTRFYSDALADLPFKRFQNELKMRGVCLEYPRTSCTMY
jgi:hypothetical protein